MERTKKSRILKNNLIVFAVTLSITVLYLGSRKILSGYEIYYRNWAVVLGDVIAFVILPFVTFALPVTAALQRKRNAKEGRDGSVLFALALIGMGLVALIYSFVGSVVFIFTADEEFEAEQMMEGEILRGIGKEADGWETYTVYHYYEPISFCLKKNYEPLSEALELQMKETYGEEFTVCAEDKEQEQQRYLRLYTLQSVQHPEIVVHMFSGGGAWGIADDYLQAKTNWILSQNEDFMDIAKMPENVTEEEARSTAERLWTGPRVRIASKRYGEPVAGTIAEAVDELLRDENFRTQEGKRASIILDICYSDGTCEAVEVVIGDYLTKEWLLDKITEKYESHETGMHEGQMAEKLETAVDNRQEDEAVIEPDTTAPETVEGAYQCLYEAVFEPLGEPYEYSYNAKGNFYAVLSTVEEVPSGGEREMKAAQSVVYDRISENGECHLFVHYKTYYDESDIECGTIICNTYAVNMESGEVAASGKHAWADVGTAQYQEFTGEK